MTKKVLMVCLGNICRSPLAEEMLRKKAKENGLNIEMDSAGLESFHVGEAPDYRTQKNARSHGMDISHLRARQFKTEDFERFDRIFVMDKMIYRGVVAHAKSQSDVEKVTMMMDVLYPDEGLPVPDPYLGGEQGFEEVYQMLQKACTRAAELISENKL